MQANLAISFLLSENARSVLLRLHPKAPITSPIANTIDHDRNICRTRIQHVN